MIELACWLSDLVVQWGRTLRSTRGACAADSRLGLVGLVRGWRDHYVVGTKRGIIVRADFFIE